MAKKKDRDKKREQEEAERAAAHEAAERRRRVMRIVNIGVPAATLIAVAITWFVTENQSTAAFVGLIGMGLWVPILLGSLGATVPPRDRNRAGSIDFGQRK